MSNKRFTEPLELIRSARTLLDPIEMDTNKASMDFTDFAARFNILVGELVEKNEKFKGVIKSDLTTQGKTIAEGQVFLGEMSVVQKQGLDTPKVKAFLGKRLPDFMVTRAEKRLLFKAKG